MKKIAFLIISLFILIGCTTDDSEGCCCYRINYTMENGTQVEEYRWINPYWVDYQKERFKEIGYTGISFKRDYSLKTMEDCSALDTTRHLGR